MRTTSPAPLLVLLAIAGCSSPAPALGGFGDRCRDAEDCESGLCADWDFLGSACTVECSASEPCPARTSGRARCGTDGLCTGPCVAGDTEGGGSSLAICVDGVFVACSSMDATAACEECGCEPFGGGTCIAGMGCVVPRADGEACTVHAQCASGACFRSTGTCGARRAMGEDCSVDAECTTGNCSTDGDETLVGHCNQPLGSECDGDGRTETCTECIRWDSVLPGMCSRALCDPVDAPRCPSLGADRRWVCEESRDGMHRCYEMCTGSGYRCLSRFQTCDVDLCF